MVKGRDGVLLSSRMCVPPMDVGSKGLGVSYERGTPVTSGQGCLEPIVRRDGGAYRGTLPTRLPHSQENAFPYDPTVGLCLGS